MLLDFQVANYRSFRNAVRLNLAASNDDSLPGNVFPAKLPGLSKARFLRGAAIYGANASGKSNLIRAIFTLRQLVRESHTSELGGGMPHDPFLLDTESEDQPTQYSIRFVAEGVRYRFLLAHNEDQVLEESLSAFPKGKEQLWYHRLWDAEEETYKYTPDESEHFTLRRVDIDATKPNSLFLSTAANVLNHPNLGAPYRWFRDSLRALNLVAESKHVRKENTLKHISSDREKVLRFLRHADLGIKDVEVRKESFHFPSSEDGAKREPQEVTLVDFLHLGMEGESYYLDFNSESSGTKRFFNLIGPWIELLEEGQVLFLDELETSLHPLLTRELVRMVMDPKINTKNSQIVFATHDPLLLDLTLLRRDQIWLTEKSGEGDSIMYSLSEYEVPSNKRETLVRGYLAGRYGGIPYLPESLFGGAHASSVDE